VNFPEFGCLAFSHLFIDACQSLSPFGAPLRIPHVVDGMLRELEVRQRDFEQSGSRRRPASAVHPRSDADGRAPPAATIASAVVAVLLTEIDHGHTAAFAVAQALGNGSPDSAGASRDGSCVARSSVLLLVVVWLVVLHGFFGRLHSARTR
jgi:hypothetical protein